MSDPPDRRATSPLSDRVGSSADARRIADAIGALWQEIDQALSPIVGSRGVAALFERGVQLTLAAHADLASRQPTSNPTKDPVAFQSLLAQQRNGDAAALGSAFLLTFRSLLASLIGPSLTERLLRTAWGPASADPPEEDLP